MLQLEASGPPGPPGPVALVGAVLRWAAPTRRGRCVSRATCAAQRQLGAAPAVASYELYQVK